MADSSNPPNHSQTLSPPSAQKAVVCKNLLPPNRKGWYTWLVQRTTAVIMVLFTLLVLCQWLFSRGGMVYDRWAGIFDTWGMKILTMLTAIAVLAHIWVGMRDILTDYVKDRGTRLRCYIFTWVWLIACVGWLAYILWRL